MEQRTKQQNKAMRKLFSLLSDELNEKGLEMKVILKSDCKIWWTPEAILEYLWRPLQKVMYQKESTTQLTTQEVNKIYEQLAKIIGEKHGIEINFPSQQETDNYLKSYENK